MDPTPACYSAAGNRFAILDGRGPRLPSTEDAARTAVALCAREGLDGLLIASADRTGAVRMAVVNRDGTPAEACGNGLRCVARFAFEQGWAGESFVIETASGPRSVVCRVVAGQVTSVRTSMGVPRRVASDEELEGPAGPVRADLVDLGNPHCVVWTEDVDRAPVREVGSALQRHGRFPGGVNVSFAEVLGGRSSEDRAASATTGAAGRLPPGGWGVAVGGLRVRTWERGVGETAACGTGVSAVVVSAVRQGRAVSPVQVRVRGGLLTVEWDGHGELFLEGPVERLSPAGAH
jgi:diaminopimelate epimerase